MFMTAALTTTRIEINTLDPVDFSSASITGVEGLTGGYSSGVSLTAGQLDGLSYLNTGAITLTGAGTANLSGAQVYTYYFNLSEAGNTLDFTGDTTNAHSVTGWRWQ